MGPNIGGLNTRLILTLSGFYRGTYCTYLEEDVSELGHMSLENTACRVSHSIKARLWVFTIPGEKTEQVSK